MVSRTGLLSIKVSRKNRIQQNRIYNHIFSDDEEDVDQEAFKVKLDKYLFDKTVEIESKRAISVKNHKKIEAMPEGPLKKRLLYNEEQVSLSNCLISPVKSLNRQLPS